MYIPSVDFIALIIFIALVFDFTNGFHDAANSVSTIISTKVLSPQKAIAFAAFFNFVAAFGFGVAVASTISKIINLGIVDTNIVPFVILAALLGAICWNLITWYSGLPTSSSHALIGGLAGAGLSAGGLAAIKIATVNVVVLFMVLSPIIGFIMAFFVMALVVRISRGIQRMTAERYFRSLQLLSAAAYSFSHGTNDAQKTMGIITTPSLQYRLLWRHGRSEPSPCPIMGHPCSTWRDCTGNALWRVENCQDHGIRDHKAAPRRWFRCRDGGIGNHHRRIDGRYTGQHHACHIFVDHGRWSNPGSRTGQVECCTPNRVGMDPDHPCVRNHGISLLLRNFLLRKPRVINNQTPGFWKIGRHRAEYDE